MACYRTATPLRTLVVLLSLGLCVAFSAGFRCMPADPSPETIAALDFLANDAYAPEDLADLARTAELSFEHLRAISAMLRLQNKSRAEVLAFSASIEEYSEGQVADIAVLGEQQVFPNSCFGHGLLEIIAKLDPSFALRLWQNPDALEEQERDMMAGFYGGTYESATMAEQAAAPFAKQVLGGVSPEQILPGVRMHLGPLTGLSYALAQDSSSSSPGAEFGLQTVAPLIARIDQAFDAYPEHPLLMYSFNHVTVLSERLGRGDTAMYVVFNPINGSFTELAKSEFLLVLDASGVFHDRSADGKGLEGARYDKLLEQGGFPIVGVIVPNAGAQQEETINVSSFSSSPP